MRLSKLRIDLFDNDTTTTDLLNAFEGFEVREVSLHRSATLFYALITLPYEAMERALDASGDRRPKIRGRRVCLEIANRYRGRWLSHEWHPPKQGPW